MMDPQTRLMEFHTDRLMDPQTGLMMETQVDTMSVAQVDGPMDFHLSESSVDPVDRLSTGSEVNRTKTPQLINTEGDREDVEPKKKQEPLQLLNGEYFEPEIKVEMVLEEEEAGRPEDLRKREVKTEVISTTEEEESGNQRKKSSLR